MGVTIDLSDGNQAIAPSAGNVIARVGCTSMGTANTCTEWDGGQDTQVASTVGYGSVVESTARALRINGEHAVLVKANASIAGVVGAVTHGTGSGPSITATGSPFGYFSLALKIITKGVLGVAQALLAKDGSTFDTEIDLPAELPATVVGTVDLTGAGVMAALAAKTLLLTPDGGSLVTVTFGSPADPTAVATAVQTALGANGTATIVGGRFLKVTGITKGSAGALIIGAGTGNSTLGVVASTIAGLASTFAIPKTGVTLTFSSGTYDTTDSYTIPVTGPRMTLADAQAALDALRASGIRFGIVEICQDPVDGVDVMAWANMLDAKISGWHTAISDRIFPLWLLGSSLGSVTGQNQTANDADVKAACNGYVSLFGAIVHGDIYATGAEWTGAFRRSLRVTASESSAGHRLSADLGNGQFLPMDQASMRGPDGVTLARDENFSTTKMGGAGGNGFTVAKRESGDARFVRSVSRANQNSKLSSWGVLRMAREAQRIVYQRALTYQNTDWDLAADGTLRESDATAIEDVFTNDMTEGLVTPDHASAVSATVDRSKVTNDAGIYPLTINWQVQMKGQVTDVKGTVSIVNQITSIS